MAERKKYEYQDDDLERYGVWVKAGPEDVVEANEEFTLSDLPINDLSEVIDLEEDDTPNTPNMSREPPDDSLEIDALGSDDLEDPLDLEELGFEDEDELVSFDDIDLEEPAEEGPPDSTIPGSDDMVGAIGLDDTAMDESDSEELPELEPEEPGEKDHPVESGVFRGADESATQQPMDAREREALLQIQTELTDIKRELAELKKALHPGVSPTAFPSVEEEEPAPATDEDEAEAAHGLGFFEEDEDETIALTGDELDNILNTAEFTEQAGEAEELDDDPAVNELVTMDINQELSDIDSLSDNTFEEQTVGDEIYLDALDEMDSLDEATGEDFDTFATAVEEDITRGESPEAEVASTEIDEIDKIDEIDEIELEDDFDDENDKEEEDEEVESDGEEEIELDLDESDIVSEIDRIPSEEGVSVEETLDASSVEAASIEAASIEFDATSESPETTDTDVDVDVESLEATPMTQALQTGSSIADLPADLKQEIRSVLSYMDQLLEALPDDKIEEFAQSEHFDVYKRLFEELGLET